MQLLQVATPLGRALLPRILVNLCSNGKTASEFLGLVFGMLKLSVGGDLKATLKAADKVLPAPAFDPSKLYGGHSNVVYSRPCEGDDLPPLVSRRIIELLAYLAKHNRHFAKLMLVHWFKRRDARTPRSAKGKGKAPRAGDRAADPQVSVLHMLFSLLASPICRKSATHLERTLALLLALFKEGHAIAVAEAAMAKEAGGPEGPGPAADAAKPGEEAGPAPKKAKTEPPPAQAAKAGEGKGGKAGPSGSKAKGPAAPALEALFAPIKAIPEDFLCTFTGLLAQQLHGSDIYKRAGEIIRELSNFSPSHVPLLVDNLCKAATAVRDPVVQELHAGAHAMDTGDELEGGFASAAAFLRVVQSLEGLVRDHPHPLEPTLEKVNGLRGTLGPLWDGLSGAIQALSLPESLHSPLPQRALNLVPVLEAFGLVHSCSHETAHLVEESAQAQAKGPAAGAEAAAPGKPPAAPRAEAPGPPGPSKMEVDLPDKMAQASENVAPFLKFCEANKFFVNKCIHQDPALLGLSPAELRSRGLADAMAPGRAGPRGAGAGSLALLLQFPWLIEFENKREYFWSKVAEKFEDKHVPSLRLLVRREYVFEDSFQYLRKKTPAEMFGKLNIQFRGEEGIDAGGVSREWFVLMGKKMFNEDLALFTSSDSGGATFQPNPNSAIQSEDVNHLDYFRFAGRVIGKALVDRQLIDAYFTRSFYKHMLGEPLTPEDIEAVDPDYYKNLKWMLENDITNVLDLNFTAETDYFGKKETVELKPAGAGVAVTEANKKEYVNLVAEHRMITAIKPQITAFLQGFWELVPKRLISIFNNQELELLISGLPDINKADLKAHTEYTGYVAASKVVRWFWEVVDEMDKEDTARLLQFCTGTSKVPLEGFKALQGISGPQKFQIHRAYGTQDRLPAAHTCFNQLDLIEYESKEKLKDRLLLAIHEGEFGFGFG